MSPDSAGQTAVVAEKPSVARDIARVLRATQQGNGYLHGNGYIVTWAIGHLVSLAQPHEIRPEWKQWRREHLPMLPKSWPLVTYENTKDQFDVVQRILNSPKVARIVCATDAGREGELIFRYIYEAAGSSKPVQRLWISSLTADAIEQGFAELKDSHEYDRLADAARGRSRADWLVGLNLSRAYTLAYQEELSVGRVQTPTLAMVVERELTIRNFVPEEYREIIATFSPQEFAKQKDRPTYQGTYFRLVPAKEPAEPPVSETRLPADNEEAKQIAARAKTGTARIATIEAETKRLAPPQLYDLTELQRHANRLYGLSAQQTLDTAQALYEKHKLISYPRTDSRHLSQSVARTLGGVIKAIRGRYDDAQIAPGTGQRSLSARFVDDTKVSDHHAIIPTATNPAKANLSEGEAHLYDLICRRLLQAWHDDHLYDVTTVITHITNGDITDQYHSTGTAIRQEGWKVLDPVATKAAKKSRNKKDAAAEDAATGGDQALPPGLTQGQLQDVLDVDNKLKKTRPPRRF